ncbi:MAG: sigma-70 family RNA polymerase sigma factor [Acidimicrobiia bacterium]|nr:sigma-70 family RNA polymerase sigma factor [Acidimicrobiia bacterium]
MAPPADQRDDHELARAAGRGDRGALDALLARHIDRVNAVCRRICGPDDGLDATQNALIGIVRAIDRFDGRSAFTTWIHRIATNAALDELRRRSRRAVPVDPDTDRVRVPHASRSDDPERVVDQIDLDAALAQLPEDFRVAVVLRDVSDLDYAEIAATLEIPIGTVRSRISRGRAALAVILGNSETSTVVETNDHA